MEMRLYKFDREACKTEFILYWESGPITGFMLLR